MPKITERIKNGWNAFRNKDPSDDDYIKYPFTRWGDNTGYITSGPISPDQVRLGPSKYKTILASIYNRIAIDVCSCDIYHGIIDVEGNERFVKKIDSTLNRALTLEANIDQTGKDLMMDIVLSLFDEGCIGVVPTDTNVDPNNNENIEIYELRVGRILEWKPDKVKLRVYNERKGIKEEIYCDKRNVAIISNPFYSVMNEPNSTLKRLIRDINYLDRFNANNGTTKLDMIIQLPYTIKTESRRAQAEQRRNDIEKQLTGSKYGIAYTDATEKIVQLNKSLDNNLLDQITKDTAQLYTELGLTAEIMNGTASDQIMANYYARTIEPITSAIADEMTRKFLSYDDIKKGHRILITKDPFKLVTVANVASIADTMTRNAIMSSNDIRAILGMKPSDDPSADELRNKNLNESTEDIERKKKKEEVIQNEK